MQQLLIQRKRSNSIRNTFNIYRSKLRLSWVPLLCNVYIARLQPIKTSPVFTSANNFKESYTYTYTNTDEDLLQGLRQFHTGIIVLRNMFSVPLRSA